jgi:excisionase family DNA binding protein
MKMRDDLTDASMVSRPEKLAYNVGQAAQALGVSKSSVYHLISAGGLPARRICGRVVILAEDLTALVTNAEPWHSTRGEAR